MENSEIKLGGVLDFWFGELSEKDWFTSSPELDTTIAKRFTSVHQAVAAGEYWMYRTTGESLLAEIIVLDQFSRNMFRGTAQAFAYDAMALTLAQQAIAAGHDTDLTDQETMFLYLPFMHSESREIHREALILFESLSMEESLKYEKIHKKIIDEFGRYPHRNKALGRASTPEEVEYLKNNQENFF